MTDVVPYSLEYLRIARFFGECQQNGSIGLIEYREILFKLFPQFAEFRDPELDEAIKAYVQDSVDDPGKFYEPKENL